MAVSQGRLVTVFFCLFVDLFLLLVCKAGSFFFGDTIFVCQFVYVLFFFSGSVFLLMTNPY